MQLYTATYTDDNNNVHVMHFNTEDANTALSLAIDFMKPTDANNIVITSETP